MLTRQLIGVYNQIILQATKWCPSIQAKKTIIRLERKCKLSYNHNNDRICYSKL